MVECVLNSESQCSLVAVGTHFVSPCVYLSTPTPSTVREWNSLPQDIITTAPAPISFKNRVSLLLLLPLTCEQIALNGEWLHTSKKKCA